MGHFNAFEADEVHGAANGILYWLPYTAGATLVAAWSSAAHTCRSGLRAVRVFAHPDLFQSKDGVAVGVHAVLVERHDADEQEYVLAMPDLAGARRVFDAEVAVVEDDCDCEKDAKTE